MAVCDAAKICTWHAEYGCTDVFRPTTGPYSGVPKPFPSSTPCPIWTWLPEHPLSRPRATGGAPVALCAPRARKRAVTTPKPSFPSTVDVFDETNSGGCPNLRVATIMSSAPQFKNNSFSGCPRLGAVALRNTSCGTSAVPSLGCNAILNGAVPSCAGPTPGKFGYALHGVADPAVTGCLDCAACVSSAGGLEARRLFGDVYGRHCGRSVSIV